MPSQDATIGTLESLYLLNKQKLSMAMFTTLDELLLLMLMLTLRLGNGIVLRNADANDLSICFCWCKSILNTQLVADVIFQNGHANIVVATTYLGA